MYRSKRVGLAWRRLRSSFPLRLLSRLPFHAMLPLGHTPATGQRHIGNEDLHLRIPLSSVQQQAQIESYLALVPQRREAAITSDEQQTTKHVFAHYARERPSHSMSLAFSPAEFYTSRAQTTFEVTRFDSRREACKSMLSICALPSSHARSVDRRRLIEVGQQYSFLRLSTAKLLHELAERQ